jgi:hypothetical protein
MHQSNLQAQVHVLPTGHTVLRVTALCPAALVWSLGMGFDSALRTRVAEYLERLNASRQKGNSSRILCRVQYSTMKKPQAKHGMP